MITPSQVRRLPYDNFAFLTTAGREIKGEYWPNQREPKTLSLGTLVRLPDGSPFLIVQTYDVTGLLDLEALAGLGEEIELIAQRRERGDAA